MLEKLDFDHSPQCTNTALAGVRGATVVACKVRLGGRVHSWDRWKCFDVSVPCRPECSWTAVLYCLNQSLHIHQTSSVTSALQVCFSQKCAFSNMFVFIIFAWCDASCNWALIKCCKVQWSIFSRVNITESKDAAESHHWWQSKET